MTTRMKSIAAATVIALGSASVRAQQAPPSAPPPPSRTVVVPSATTAASWSVGDDLDAVIADLKSKGVTFEHYDMPDITLEGDVHVMGELKAAWFKDPDGNILNLVSR